MSNPLSALNVLHRFFEDYIANRYTNQCSLMLFDALQNFLFRGCHRRVIGTNCNLRTISVYFAPQEHLPGGNTLFSCHYDTAVPAMYVSWAKANFLDGFLRRRGLKTEITSTFSSLPSQLKVLNIDVFVNTNINCLLFARIFCPPNNYKLSCF